MEGILIKVIAPLAIMVILLLLNVPIYISILASTFYLMVFVNDISLSTTFTTLYHGIAKPSLLAIPFFVVAGNLIDRSSIGERIIYTIMPLTRKMRGGMAIAGVLANSFFGAISGSAAAAAATLGKLLYKPIADESGEEIALGVITCSGGLASIIPPSVSFILFGIATEQSIGKLFMAGFFPGIIISCILAIYCIAASPKRQSKIGVEIDKRYSNVIKNIPVILMPIIVLGGIYLGFFTPTEAGAVAAAYALIVTLYYREFNIKKVYMALLDSVTTLGRIFILVASSLALAEALTLSGVINIVTNSFSGVSTAVFLIIINIVMLISGCFFDSGAIILILSPIITPAAIQLGIDPIHLGVIVTINVAVGMFTPPFGLNLFVVQGILNKPFEKVVKSVFPLVLLYLVALVIIICFPAISTWLPSKLI